ncbi:MAG: hypothetical protein GY716_00145 [bacterium]|nr:hypothetical protein [bacterium]
MRRQSLIALPLAVLLLGAGGALAEGSRLHYGAEVAVGYDSNPLRVMDDGDNGAFTELSADLSHTIELAPLVRVFYDADATFRFHGSDRSNADFGGGELGAGLGFAPYRGGKSSVTLWVGAELAMFRTTYIDRETGDVYETSGVPLTDPPTAVAVPDRYDSDRTSFFVNTRWTLNRRVRLSLETRYETTSYREDYSKTTTLDPLDHVQLVLTPELRFRVSEAFTLRAAVAFADRDYDERPALDGSGDPVDGTQREYRQTKLRLWADFDPSGDWRVRFGLRNSERDDTFAGYYDYASIGMWASVERRIGDMNRVRLFAAMSERDYDNATVQGETDEVVLGSEIKRFSLRYDRNLSKGLRWFAEAGAQDTDNEDPVYAYDRRWVLTGIRFRR